MRKKYHNDEYHGKRRDQVESSIGAAVVFWVLAIILAILFVAKYIL